MEVSWEIVGERIHFTLSAPAHGWLGIGFNENAGLKGTYLIMGNVKDGRPMVMEHYVLSPGDYRPILDLGGTSSLGDITGQEFEDKTTIRFSVPVMLDLIYKKQLGKGKSFHLLMAYSSADDFQHHSMMRTSAKITL